MGRRARNSDSEPSFDSLLDTLFNVVGILVIMLVVTMLGVRDAVRRIKWNLPDISQARLDALKQLADKKKRDMSDAIASVKETQEVLAKLKALEEELGDLKKFLDAKSPELKTQEYVKKVAQLNKKKAELDKKAQENKKELAQLQKRLASLPKASKKASKVIRMPNPRAPAEGSTCVWVMCRYNRVCVVNTEELTETALKRIESSRYLLVLKDHGKAVKVTGDKRSRHPILRQSVNWVFDPKKLGDYFEQKNIGDRDIKLTFQQHPTQKKERLYAEPRKDGGEPVKQLRTSVSRYETAVRSIDREKHYARFLVWPDSFEVYVRAREIMEKYGVPAGWSVYNGKSYPIAWDFGIHVKDEDKPVPQPQTAGKKTKAPIVVPLLD